MTTRAREAIAASEAASSRLRTGSGVRARPSSAPFLKGSSRLSPADQAHISDLEAQIADLQTAVEVQYAAACQEQSTKFLNDNGVLLSKGGPLLLIRKSDITFAAVLCLWLFGCTDAFWTNWAPNWSQSVTMGLPLCTDTVWGGCCCRCC